MKTRVLTENMKIWLKELYINEAADNRITASNCHLWALGSDTPEGAAQWEEYAEEHRDFAIVLEKMAEELDSN